MEVSNDFLQHYKSFEKLLHMKGYTQRFAIGRPGDPQSADMLHLPEVLKGYLQHAQRAGVAKDRFYLFTYAEYLSSDDYKRCRFTVDFTPEKGFRVSGLRIESTFPRETQQLSLHDNHQIPGRNAVIGRFRRLKPWERLMQKNNLKRRRGW